MANLRFRSDVVVGSVNDTSCSGEQTEKTVVLITY
jgi:hypothetical protein